MTHRLSLRRGLRSLSLGALVASFLFLGSSDTVAAVAVGDEAPEVTGGAHFNCEPVKLSDLKGRLVFLELFSTT